MRYGTIILGLINASNSHMTAEQIFLALKQDYPTVVLATVYNNLNTLHAQGKIRRISVEGYPDRYDKNTRHDHLVCRCCGQLSDLYLADITGDIETQVGFPIESYDLKIQYLCPQCRRELNSANTSLTPRNKDMYVYKGGFLP